MPSCDRDPRGSRLGLLAAALVVAACSSAGDDTPASPEAGTGGTGGGNAGTGAVGAAVVAGTGGAQGGDGAAGAGGEAGGEAGGSGTAGEAGGGAGAGGRGGEGDVCAGQAPECIEICEGGLCQCECPQAAQCVVVRDASTCCGEYLAVTREQEQADACLIPYPALVDGSVLSDCLFASGNIDCGSVVCDRSQPPTSRIALPDGAGGCRFADECQVGDDCVSAVHSAECCACGASTPRALVEENACTSSDPVPTFPESCPRCTSQLPCGACAPASTPTCLVNDDSPNVCM